jgi:hypothetical protein
MKVFIVCFSLSLISLGAFADASAAKGSGYRYQLKSEAQNRLPHGEQTIDPSPPVSHQARREKEPQPIRPLQFFAPK